MRGGNFPMNNFLNDGISSRMSRDQTKSLNKAMGKFKKNQQQQYQ